MGRWGMRLFEGDQDLNIAVEIDAALGESDDMSLRLGRMIFQTDPLAPPAAKARYKTEEYLKRELPAIVAEGRATLDCGIGDELFKIFRARAGDGDAGGRARYRVVIVGAIMLRAGAKISDDDLRHLRDLVPQIHSLPSLAHSLRDSPARPSGAALLVASRGVDDEGFRHPGRAQFLAALDNYKPGVPRSFLEPRLVDHWKGPPKLFPARQALLMEISCYQCGKIASDISKELDQCSRCKRVWYCSKVSGMVLLRERSEANLTLETQDCQRAHWRDHKPACIAPSTCLSVNV